ncbi:unnamed protein product [Cylicostephanus goldi]|uniref:Uncharacterized protein n=1 Tax=Cylicostephanus goldi TaxID=71465 RepID=A0A3P6TKZ7_CYLGO|nr:unnamed protein product [Cylicostephanus goldi]
MQILGRSSAGTLSDYSSFEEAELIPSKSKKKKLKKKQRGEYVALTELDETFSLEREDLHTALECGECID